MLAPCPRCRRHVQIEEIRCPFCGCDGSRSAPAISIVGRISRVAVFTSAVLAAGACDQGKLPDKMEKPSPIKTGTVKGVATWSGANAFGSHSGQLGLTVVTLTHDDSGKRRTTKTNEQGAFEFVDVPVGSYTLTLPDEIGRSEPVAIQVHADTVESANLESSVAMPYGAPPRRRRVV